MVGKFNGDVCVTGLGKNVVVFLIGDDIVPNTYEYSYVYYDNFLRADFRVKLKFKIESDKYIIKSFIIFILGTNL